jgi:hypothetical protein
LSTFVKAHAKGTWVQRQLIYLSQFPDKKPCEVYEGEDKNHVLPTQMPALHQYLMYNR